ncbi:MAG: DUF393 domain-containing protein [Bdellovibrionales bacterium]|nr:DUF393 domain-containing protein [Bdellovibrionales bacterium]
MTIQSNSWTGAQFSMARFLISLASLVLVYSKWGQITQNNISIIINLIFLFSIILTGIGFKTKSSAVIACIFWTLIWFNYANVHLITFLFGFTSFFYISSLEKNPLWSLDGQKLEIPNYTWSISNEKYHDLWKAFCGIIFLSATASILKLLFLKNTINQGIFDFGGLTQVPSTILNLQLCLHVFEITLGFCGIYFGPKKNIWICLVLLLLTSFLFTSSSYYLFDLACILFAFNPSWLAVKANISPELIFYDGECGLCHRWVKFVLSEDPYGERFQFATLQSKAFERVSKDLSENVDSIVLTKTDGKSLIKSSAIVHILKSLGGLWLLTSWVLFLIPKFIRDFAYEIIAKIRYSLFKKPNDACPLMPPELRRRFIV